MWVLTLVSSTSPNGLQAAGGVRLEGPGVVLESVYVYLPIVVLMSIYPLSTMISLAGLYISRTTTPERPGGIHAVEVGA